MRNYFEETLEILKIVFVCFCLAGVVFLGYNYLNEVNTTLSLLHDKQVETQETISDVYDKIISAQMDMFKTTEEVSKNTIETARDIMTIIKESVDNSLDRDKALLKLIYQNEIQVNKTINNITKKPSIDYLDSITVLIASKNNISDDSGWVGTGVVIKQTEDYTYILTNKHVCEENQICYIQEGSSKYPAKIVKRSMEDYDMQILSVIGKIENKRCVKGLADTKRGDSIFVVGHRLGVPFIYGEGVVSGFNTLEVNKDLIIAAPTGPGNSGSGIINSDGYLVGLLYAGSLVPYSNFHLTLDLTHAFCVNSKVLREFLKGYLD